MDRKLKVAFYLLLFGFLTFFSAVFWNQPPSSYPKAAVLGQTTGLELFIQPVAGTAPLVARIDSAQKEILVEVYLLSDKTIISALKEARNRGVSVRVMLEEHPFGGGNLNTAALPDLITSGIEARWTNPAFALTHEKAMVIDDQVVCILSQNLTTSAFSKNREYDICDDNAEEVKEADGIFNADWERKSFSPTATNLVVSPDNSRGKLTTLVKSAKNRLDLEVEVLSDKQIVELLRTATETIPVRVILPPTDKIEGSAGVIGALKASGVSVRTMSSPYVHAKLIVVDKDRAYIGSVNLSSQSLDQNRELGILISQPDIVGRLSEQFEKDWASAR